MAAACTRKGANYPAPTGLLAAADIPDERLAGIEANADPELARHGGEQIHRIRDHVLDGTIPE